MTAEFAPNARPLHAPEREAPRDDDAALSERKFAAAALRLNPETLQPILAVLDIGVFRQRAPEAGGLYISKVQLNVRR